MVLLFYCEMLSYFFTRSNSPISPKIGIIITMVLTVPLLLDKGRFHRSITNTFLKWIACYQFMITLFYFFTTLIFYHKFQDLILDDFKKFSLVNILMVILIIVFDDPKVFKLTKKLVVAAVIMNAGINVYDLVTFNKDIFSPFFGRGAGFYINPNLSYMALIWGMILTIKFVPKSFQFWYLLICGVGVGFTMSRGGTATFILIVIAIYVVKLVSFKSSFFWLMTLIIVGIFSFQTLLSKANKGIQEGVYNSQALLNRLDQIINPSASHFVKDTRFEVLSNHVNLYLSSPVLGNGIGSSNYYRQFFSENANSHNQIIHNLNEFGLLGILILLTLGLAMSLTGKVIHVTPELILLNFSFLLFCFFSHNLLHHYMSAFCFAFMNRLTIESHLISKYSL